jgi:hypothetical protein
MNASQFATLRTLCDASAKCFTLDLRDAYNTVPQDDLQFLIAGGFWYRGSATQGNLTERGAEALRSAKARLDSDRTAKPLTRLVAKVPAGDCVRGTATHYEGADGQRVALQAKPDAFRDFLHALGYDPRPYSGRGMYGDECWAIDVTPAIFAAAILDYEQDTRLDPDTRAMAIRALQGAREDSMGRGSVLYFPTEKV